MQDIRGLSIALGFYPKYHYIGFQGPPHAIAYEFECQVGVHRTRGGGPSKKKAKRAAALRMKTILLNEIALEQSGAAVNDPERNVEPASVSYVERNLSADAASAVYSQNEDAAVNAAGRNVEAAVSSAESASVEAALDQVLDNQQNGIQVPLPTDGSDNNDGSIQEGQRHDSTDFREYEENLSDSEPGEPVFLVAHNEMASRSMSDPGHENRYFSRPLSSFQVCRLCHREILVPEIILLCDHKFHEICLRSWLEGERDNGRFATCPTCHQAINAEFYGINLDN